MIACCFPVFLCCVSAVFFPDVDAVRFSHTKDEYVLPVTNRVRYSVLISAAEPVVTAVCSQPGQVAPVTLHRPCRTKHFFPRRAAAPPTRNFADPVTLTWLEGWLMYTTWQCAWSSSQSTWNDTWIHGYVERYIPLCAQSPLLNEFMFLENPRYKTQHNDFFHKQLFMSMFISSSKPWPSKLILVPLVMN